MQPPRLPRLGKTAGFFILQMCLTLGSGCTPWPGTATGGLAERFDTESPTVLMLEERYGELMRNGGEHLAASRMVDVRNLLNRARRELAGGLPEDGYLTLSLAHQEIERAEFEVSRRLH